MAACGPIIFLFDLARWELSEEKSVRGIVRGRLHDGHVWLVWKKNLRLFLDKRGRLSYLDTYVSGYYA